MRRNLKSSIKEDLVRESYEKELEKALLTLTEREHEVINLYFGMKTDHPLTFREIGSKLNISSARAQQIKCKALKRLRHSSRSIPLRNHIYKMWKSCHYWNPEIFIIKEILGLSEGSEPEPEVEVLDRLIESLELSVRASNAFKALGRRTIRDITEMSPDEFMKFRGVGLKTVREVKWILGELDLSFRPDVEEILGLSEGLIDLEEDDILDRPIGDLGLSTRPSNGLRARFGRHGTIRDITDITESEFRWGRNVGLKTMREVKSILRKLGLSFKSRSF